jgi:hypothetical protein
MFGRRLYLPKEINDCSGLLQLGDRTRSFLTGGLRVTHKYKAGSMKTEATTPTRIVFAVLVCAKNKSNSKAILQGLPINKGVL